MITERTLKRWRIDALKTSNNVKLEGTPPSLSLNQYLECQERILKLTQELMDMKLVLK